MAAVESDDQIKKAHFTYIWKIESPPLYSIMESPEFTVQSMEKTHWSLSMNLDVNGKACLALRRKKTEGGPDTILIEYEFSILDKNGSSLMKISCKKDFRNDWRDNLFSFFNEDASFNIKRNELDLRNALKIGCRMKIKRPIISKPELCFARTCYSVHESSCVWAVKKFSSLKQGEKRTRILNSTIGCPQVILSLSLDERENVFIDMEITDKSCIVGEISLLDAEGMFVDFRRVKAIWLGKPDICRLCAFKKSVLIFNKILLPDDVLVLQCELMIISAFPFYNKIEDYIMMDYSDSKPIQTNKSGMLPDELSGPAVCPFKAIITKFKEDGTLSDVCLRVNNKSFPVHKLILSSRSPVFRAMFTKDMREKTSKIIDIPDLDADTLDGLLLYIYENKVQELKWEAAADLFEAADKYELLDLKEKCSYILKSNVNKSNFCKILVLADMHHDESLRKSAQEFIINNSEILHSDIWKVFKEEHSRIALEAAEQMIYNMTKNSKS